MIGRDLRGWLRGDLPAAPYWWAMYVTSTAVGYLPACVMLMLGSRFRDDARAIIRETARGHADDAAKRQGPHLAPVTFFAIVCVVMTIAGALLVRRAS